MSGLPDLLRTDITLDLFVPPQRERFREAVVRMTMQGMKQREIVAVLQSQAATRLPREKVTLPAVQRALALHRQMTELGLASPYLVLLDPPENYTKLRRHKNCAYRVEPTEGYVRPEL